MLEFNLNLFLYQLGIFCVFAVCVAVIYRTLFAPVMRERRERIEGDLTRAAAARAEAEEMRRRYELKMAQVGEEAAAIMKRVAEEAAKHREELLAQTRKQSEQLLAQTQKLIAMEEARAAARLRAELADIAADVAARVLDETRTPERERALAAKFLEELERAGGLDKKRVTN